LPVAEGAALNSAVTLLLVGFVLWLALKKARIISAVFVNLMIGLLLTAAAGLWMVGALNPISIAFGVLFVGLGVDFGIQFSVRYRSERHACSDLDQALVATSRRIAGREPHHIEEIARLEVGAIAASTTISMSRCEFCSFSGSAPYGLTEF
jgi:hypothetical protein